MKTAPALRLINGDFSIERPKIALAMECYAAAGKRLGRSYRPLHGGAGKYISDQPVAAADLRRPLRQDRVRETEAAATIILAGEREAVALSFEAPGYIGRLHVRSFA